MSRDLVLLWRTPRSLNFKEIGMSIKKNVLKYALGVLFTIFVVAAVLAIGWMIYRGTPSDSSYDREKMFAKAGCGYISVYTLQRKKNEEGFSLVMEENLVQCQGTLLTSSAANLYYRELLGENFGIRVALQEKKPHTNK
jgi:hypothetical protein